MNINWNPTPKQFEAWKYLTDKETTEMFFGGGAGGGKSRLGCSWAIILCLQYPGVRGLFGRASLKALKSSTLATFFDICKEWGLEAEKHFTYNSMEGVIKWSNGSEIHLRDLELYPSDPEFDRLGSTEYTFVFVDEASEVTAKVKNVLMSRIRYKLNEYGLVPKLFIASNPAKNFLYHEFYKPWKENKLPSYRKFIPSLVGDNPYIPKSYVENLKKMDKNTKERLLYGNFEYDDDPSRLFEYDLLVDLFSNEYAERGSKFLSVDVARFGKDTTTIYVWDGLMVTHAFSFSKRPINELVNRIESLCREHKVPRSHVVVDEDGVGGGVVDHLPGCYGFVNNSKPLAQNGTLFNYSNLKSQCYFKLAELVRDGKIGIVPDQFRDLLISELEQIKRKDVDKDTQKISVVSKDEIKEKLGRSPDHADCLMMRMVFELNSQKFVFLEDPSGLVL